MALPQLLGIFPRAFVPHVPSTFKRVIVHDEFYFAPTPRTDYIFGVSTMLSFVNSLCIFPEINFQR